MRVYITIFLAFMFYSTTACAMTEGDAICMGSAIPPGFVPVGTLSSSECGTDSNGIANAWVLGSLKDNVISCRAPDYLKDPAPNIGYVACGRAISSACPATFDGTTNAFVLRPADICVTSAVRDHCDESSVLVGGQCLRIKEHNDCYRQLDLSIGRYDRYWFYVAVGKGSGKIIKQKPHPLGWPLPPDDVCEYAATRIYKTPTEYWPLCIIGNEEVLISQFSYLGNGAYLVRRLFYDSRCAGTPGEINAMIVRQPEQSNETQNLCVLPRTWNPYKNRAMDYYYADLDDAAARHDDACGINGFGPNRLNSIRIN